MKVKKKILLGFKTYVFPKILSALPKAISVKLAQMGYSDAVPKGISFRAKCFNTGYFIEGNTSRAVDVEATSVKGADSIARELIIQFLKKGDVALDIGANIGSYSLLMAKIVGDEGKVISFEPGPLFETLKKNTENNNLSKIILPMNIGLSNTEGSLKWYEDLNNPGNAHLVSDASELNFNDLPTKLSDSYTEVKVFRLDDISEKLPPKIDFMKIDVEGMEDKVIEGALETIKVHKPILLVETMIWNADLLGYDFLSKIRDMILPLGYEFYKTENGKLKKVIHPNYPCDTIMIPISS
jgi:FkbM family methyltransferase